MKGELSSLLLSAMAAYLRMKKETRFDVFTMCHGVPIIELL